MESPHAREFRLRLEGDRAVEIAASAGGRRARTPEAAISAVRTPPLTKTLDVLGACLRLLAFALLGSPRAGLAVASGAERVVVGKV